MGVVGRSGCGREEGRSVVGRKGRCGRRRYGRE